MQSVHALGLLVALATCFALPPVRRPVPQAIIRTQITDDLGQFSINYVNSDGLSVSDTQVLTPTPDGRDLVPARRGSYRYISPEGIPISVSFIADLLGYRIISPPPPAAAPALTSNL